MSSDYHCFMDSPVGRLLLTSDGTALTGLLTQGNSRFAMRQTGQEEANCPPFVQARQQLESYFSGSLRRFDLPLAPAGTLFQRQVWMQLEAIAYGESVSYAHLAQKLGAPRAVRAAAAANGRNPICILIPCHRVIGKNGALTGYNGGLATKQWLLDHERRFGTGRL